MEISRELNIGRAGEHLAMADLLLKGEQAYTTGQGANYDIIVDKNGRLIRLQVKTTQKIKYHGKCANPVYFFHIKRMGKNGAKRYMAGDFEGFALVVLDRREVYYLKNDGKIGTASICIRDREIAYSPGGGPSGIYLQDLTWENFIK